MSQHVDGEEEQLESVEPIVTGATTEVAKMLKRPVPRMLVELLRWVARESFRVGYRHAHERTTVQAPSREDD